MNEIMNEYREVVLTKIRELKDAESQEKFEEVWGTVDEMLKRSVEVSENDLKLKQLEFEKELKAKQMDDERKDRWVKNSITAAGIAIPSIITIWGTLKSLKFEETGTITTMAGRSFINRLFPKK